MAKVSATENDRRNLDIILLFDHSYSMFESSDARMYEAQVAATKFIDHLDPAYDRVGLIRFSEYAEVQKPLGTPFKDVKSKIDSYHIDYFSKFTNMQKAIVKAEEELSIRGRPDAEKIIILLSDGEINRPRLNAREDLSYARSLALTEVDMAARSKIIIHTVSIGKDNVDQDLLATIASRAGGKNYIATSPVDLIPIYKHIAKQITNSPESDGTPMYDPSINTRESENARQEISIPQSNSSRYLLNGILIIIAAGSGALVMRLLT